MGRLIHTEASWHFGRAISRRSTPSEAVAAAPRRRPLGGKRQSPDMAAGAEQYESDLDDDRSEASGFSDDDEQDDGQLIDAAAELDSGAEASAEGGSDGDDSGADADVGEASGSDAESSGDEQTVVGSTATARDGERAYLAQCMQPPPRLHSGCSPGVVKCSVMQMAHVLLLWRATYCHPSQ